MSHTVTTTAIAGAAAPAEATRTWRVVIIETIVHATTVEAGTCLEAERIASAMWDEDGPEAFTAETLGRSQAVTTQEVTP